MGMPERRRIGVFYGVVDQVMSKSVFNGDPRIAGSVSVCAAASAGEAL
jgi:hypothetical protein